MTSLKQLFVFIFPVVLFVLISCKKDEEPPVETEPERVLVDPISTDAGYESGQDSHLVMRDNELSLNRLLLFIGGSYSKPENYETICEHARELGFDVISISYPNNITAASLGDSEDLYAFDNYRDEICYGNPVSEDVDVNELNAILTRATKLLIYLNAMYPEQNWGQYLIDGNAPDWSKIIVAGHSQGAGHACYLGKTNAVNRVVMFSGPNDYSDHFTAPANWLSGVGITPVSKQFAFLHLEDEAVPYDKQLENIRAIGLLGAEETTTLMDDLSSPYDNKNAFHTTISAVSNHSSTIGGNWKLPPFWTYLFTEE